MYPKLNGQTFNDVLHDKDEKTFYANTKTIVNVINAFPSMRNVLRYMVCGESRMTIIPVK